MSGLLHKITHRHKATEQAGLPALAPTPLNTTVPLAKTSTGFNQGTALNSSTGVPLYSSGGLQNTTLNTTTVGQTVQHPTQVTHSLAPIIQETVRQDRVVEVQPVLHREVDKNIVHHIEKHSVERAPFQGGVVECQPIVQQHVNTNVVNEIQPIIHRERVVPVTEVVEEHLQQHIVEATIHTHQVVYEMAPSTFTQQGFNNTQLPLQQGLGQQGLTSSLPLQQGLTSGLPLQQQGLASGLPLQQGLNSSLPLQQGLNSSLPLQQQGFSSLEQGPTSLPGLVGLTGQSTLAPTSSLAPTSALPSLTKEQQAADSWNQQGVLLGTSAR